MDKFRVLLVEDLPEFQMMVPRALGAEFDVTVAGDIQSAKAAVKDGSFDLLIVDVHLPDGNGLDFAAALAGIACPIVALTGLSDTHDKVLGWSAGVEDYITKPFEAAEFRMRILTRVQKFRNRQKQGEALRWMDFDFNLTNQSVVVHDSPPRSLDLTPHEYKILLLLVKNEGHLLTREELIRFAWGEGMHISSRTVDRHISTLRRKLSAQKEYIQTVSGKGYRLVRPAVWKKSS